MLIKLADSLITKRFLTTVTMRCYLGLGWYRWNRFYMCVYCSYVSFFFFPVFFCFMFNGLTYFTYSFRLIHTHACTHTYTYSSEQTSICPYYAVGVHQLETIRRNIKDGLIWVSSAASWVS